jgi:hypothetical protein
MTPALRADIWPAMDEVLGLFSGKRPQRTCHCTTSWPMRSRTCETRSKTSSAANELAALRSPASRCSKPCRRGAAPRLKTRSSDKVREQHRKFNIAKEKAEQRNNPRSRTDHI